MRKTLLCLLLVACGEITREPDPGLPPDHPDLDGITVDPGDGCVAIDWNQTCPNAPDAGVPPQEPDASVPPELDDDAKAACCHALLDGSPPNHECGYPPGLCKNGKKTMFCKNAEGGDAQFELCNP